MTKTTITKRNGISFHSKKQINLSNEDNLKYLLLLNNASSRKKSIPTTQPQKDLVALRQYISKSLVNQHNIFLTVTFKEAIQTVNGSIKRIDLQDVIRTAKYLKNNIGGVFGGRRKRIDFIPCVQKNSSNMYHLHIVFGGFRGAKTFEELKENSFEKLQNIVGGICSDHELLHNQRDVQISYDINGLIDYNSRLGVSSWIPEATILRSRKKKISSKR